VGCGRTAPKSELVRLAAVDQRTPADGATRSRRVTIDPAGTLPGRGAYLCRGAAPDAPVPDCLALALQRGGLPRTLRCAVAIPAELVESVSR